MNTKGAKLLLFSLIIMLFSLVLVFASFVSLAIEVAAAVINTTPPIGRGVGILSWSAIIASIGGLFVAWFGLNRND